MKVDSGQNSLFYERHRSVIDLLRVTTWTNFDEVADAARLSKTERKLLKALCEQEQPSPASLARELHLTRQRVDLRVRNGIGKIEPIAALLGGYANFLHER